MKQKLTSGPMSATTCPSQTTAPRQSSRQTRPKDIALVDGAGPVHLLVSQLEVDVRMPGLLLRPPLHPALEHLPGTSDVPEHLLHVCVLVPSTESSELIGHGQNDFRKKRSLAISGSNCANTSRVRALSSQKVKSNMFFLLNYKSEKDQTLEKKDFSPQMLLSSTKRFFCIKDCNQNFSFDYTAIIHWDYDLTD